MRQVIEEVFRESMAIPSFTNTALERDIEAYLLERLGSVPYFQKHPANVGAFAVPDDFYQRQVIWALVEKGGADTVILFHHHDTVDIEDFGSLKDRAFNDQALKEALPGLTDREEVLADLASGSWRFGRGSCDMKAALALQLGVLESYAGQPGGQVNLLYLSVCDEEAYSQGMRAAVSLLYQLKEERGLRYLLAIDSEPFESPAADQKVLHVGTVGKLMPVLVTQGLLSHMKEPLKGVNALSLLVRLAAKLDLNPLLADQARGEQSPLPSWSYVRDLKEGYDVSTVLRAAGYLTLFYMEASPAQLIERIKELCQEAVNDFYEELLELQEAYSQPQAAAPQVLTYQELVQRCQSRPGFANLKKQLAEEARRGLAVGQSYQDISIAAVQSLLDFYDRKEALVVIAVAPPYYPSMNGYQLSSSPVDMAAVTDLYRSFLAERGSSLTVEEYFMGICDMSYCALEKPVADYQKVLDSMAVPADLYSIDFSKIAAVNVPAINLGPWGKDLHQQSERVYEEDMLETVPAFLLHLLQHAERIKRA